jgi:hypothetical protein
MGYNTILLKGDLGRRYEEARASGAGIFPGYLIERRSDGKVQPHSVRGGKWARAVAIEDALAGLDLVNTRGNTIDSNYLDADLVRYMHLSAAEIFYAALHQGENVAKGDYAISYGDGTVAKAASAYLADVVAPSTVITNTITETTFSNGTVTIPANTLKVGDVIRIRAQGTAPATNSTDTLTINLKLGATTIATTGALDVANNDVFVLDIYLTIRTIGAAGTFVANGQVTIGTPGTATFKVVNLASTAIDTTAANTLTVTATWSVANAGNQVRMDQLMVEQVKAAGATASAGPGSVIGTFEDSLDNSAGSTYGRVPVLVL